MKLFHSFGMNPRLVRMFLLEKGVYDAIERVDIDVLAGENRQAPYLEKNPAGQTPLLELDDGTYLSESAAICEYIEEQLPGHSLIGTTAAERAETRMWWRRVEINIAVPMVQAFYSKEAYEIFRSRVHCLPEAADGLKEKAHKALAWIDGLLGDKPYLCGDRFSVADICLFTYVDQLSTAGQPIPLELEKIQQWHARVSQRPSATQSLWPEQPMGMRG